MLKGGSHLFQSCLHAVQDGFPFATKEMHPSFENFVVTNASSLHAPWMNIHHDTSFRYI
jgi:hypothetical protein